MKTPELIRVKLNELTQIRLDLAGRLCSVDADYNQKLTRALDCVSEAEYWFTRAYERLTPTQERDQRSEERV